MDEPVQPIYGRPILTRATETHRLNTIAVHTNATTPDGLSYDVIFLGTGKPVLTIIVISCEFG